MKNRLLMKTGLWWGLMGMAGVGRSAPSTGAEVVFFNRETMAAAFEAGQRLVTTAHYTVSASRRDKVGTAEIHDSVTDIFYFVAGSATFVTGGTLVDSRQTGPGEWRGSRSEGGVARTVSAGDVIIVPKGTPHWFSEVDGVIQYHIVKVNE